MFEKISENVYEAYFETKFCKALLQFKTVILSGKKIMLHSFEIDKTVV